jgi:ankyrin repeat protein
MEKNGMIKRISIEKRMLPMILIGMAVSLVACQKGAASLEEAVASGKIEKVDAFIKALKQDQREEADKRALLLAGKTRQLWIVMKLAEREVPISEWDGGLDAQALPKAIAADRLDVFYEIYHGRRWENIGELLVQAAQANPRDDALCAYIVDSAYEDTDLLLRAAAAAGDTWLVQLVLKRPNADPLKQDEHGMTGGFFAKTLEVAQVMKDEAGFRTREAMEDPNTKVFLRAVRDGDAETVKRSVNPYIANLRLGWLEREGPYMESRESSKTPLMAAAALGNMAIVEALVANGARIGDTFTKAVDGSPSESAMDIAVGWNHFDVAEYLFLHGAREDKGSMEGQLIANCAYGNDGFVSFLVDKGVNPNASNGKSDALSEAISRKDLKLVDYLRSKGAKWSGFDMAAFLDIGDAKSARELLASGVKPNAAALIAACGSGELELAKALLGQGLDPNGPTEADYGDYDKSGPLQVAILKNDPAMVRLLLEKGADPNRRIPGFSEDYPPLEYARSMNRNPDIEKALLDHGAKPQ